MFNSSLFFSVNRLTFCSGQLLQSCETKLINLILKIKKFIHQNFKDLANFFCCLFLNKNKPIIKKPNAIFVLGSPGSGKNFYVDKFYIGEKFASYQIIDADIEMAKIPEYQEAVKNGDKDAADRFHAQALQLKNKLFSKTKNAKHNLIYVGSGAHLEFYKNIITSLKTQYFVKTVFIEASLERVLKRVQARGDLTGRVVPEKVVRNHFIQAKANFSILSSLADEFDVYNNDVETA